jgi:hypothetical protein
MDAVDQHRTIEFARRLLPGEYPEVPEGDAVWVFALE